MKKGWDADDALRENVPDDDLTALLDDADPFREPEDKEANVSVQKIESEIIKLSDWSAARYAGPPPERQWLIKGIVPRGILMMLAAMGGVGKSYLALYLGLEVATGDFRDDDSDKLEDLLGGPVERHGTVVFITAEDDKAEVHRRLSAIDPTNRRLIRPQRLRIVPLPDVGASLTILEKDFSAPLVTSAYEMLREQLLEIEDLALVIFDPLQAFVGGDANQDPAVGQYLCMLLGRLARESGATVILTHHFRKQTKINSPAEAREAIRGTTALVDGMRCVYALWYADEKSARKICADLGIDYVQNLVAYGAVVKANFPVEFGIHVYVRDNSGLLRNRTDHDSLRGHKHKQSLQTLLDAVATAALEGLLFTKTGKHGVYECRKDLPPELQTIARGRLQTMVQNLLDDGRLIQRAITDDQRPIWLDVPNGSHSSGGDDDFDEEPPI